MKFAYTADIHLSKYGQDKVEEESNLPERLHSIKETLYNIGNYCYDNDIRTFIIGGDILHNKSVIYSVAQEIMLDFFDAYGDIEFWVIDGNHDLSGKGAEAISSLRSLHSVENVVWITQHSSNSNDNILFVPYSYDMIKTIKESKADILISHFGLNEGILNSGISIIADLGLKDLIGKYKLVLLGHYHKPQEIINDQISLYYVGSPVQLDWGEKNEDKRFLVVDTETLQVESIPTTGYKKYLEYEITEENKLEIIERARKEQEYGSYVKIVKKDKIDLGDNIDDLQIIDKSEVDITNRGISTSMSKADIFKRYAEAREVSEKEIEYYLKVATQLIEGDIK
jgi:DNA repair exonuclease SbcCD nuclease subunit